MVSITCLVQSKGGKWCNKSGLADVT